MRAGKYGFLAFLFLWCVASQANPVLKWCQQILALTYFKPASDWLSKNGLKEKVTGIFQRYLEAQKNKLQHLTPPETITIEGKSYKILQPLGQGSESDGNNRSGVYLAEGADGQRYALKIFTNRDLMEQNLLSLERIPSEGRVQTVKTLGRDGSQLTAVFEYAQGVPVQYLLSAESGLSAKEQKVIEERFNTFIRAYNYNFLPHNTVLDPLSGEFIVFDPT